jgi:hypothetical protein
MFINKCVKHSTIIFVYSGMSYSKRVNSKISGANYGNQWTIHTQIPNKFQ